MTEIGRRQPRALPMVAFLLLAVGAFLRLRNAWIDLDLLSLTTLPDDTFYDLAIARNIARGAVPSIDGVHATNGYHPLWVTILAGVFRFTREGDARTPVHVALTLGALCDVAAGYFLWRVARRLRLGLGALFAVGVVSLSAYATVNATCGLETPLALLLLLVLVDRQLAAPTEPSERWFVGFGALAGLCVLARTDAAVLGLVLIGVTAWRMKGPPVPRLRRVALAGVAATVVVSPWLLYSWRTTGTLVQSSAVALSLVAERLPQVWGFTHTSLGLRLERAVCSLREGLDLTMVFFGIGRIGLACAGVGAVAAIVLAKPRQRRFLRAQLLRAAPFLGALVLLFLLHVLVRQVYRPWYTAPMIAGLALLLGLAAQHLLRVVPARALVTAGVALGLLLCLGHETRVWQTVGIYGLADYRGMKPTVKLHQGHTDCGAVAYFHGSGITNLDGVVNNEALSALRSGSLLDYLRKERFERVYATDHFHSSVFFGERYRESLRTHEADVRAVRLVADAAEKDRLIDLGGGPISLGGVAGRELLSDGWVWNSEPPPTGFATSLGQTSDVIFALPPSIGSRPTVELELRAAVVDASGEQPVEVEVDGRVVANWRVPKKPAWYVAPIPDPRPGRHRLRLHYGAPSPVREVGPHGSWEWWRSLRGNLVRAVDADGIRLVRSEDLRLPPVGPTFDKPASDRLLVSGFLSIERDATPAAVWAVGLRAEVVFFDDAAPSDRVLRLEVGPPAREGEESGQTLTVLLNGHSLGEPVLPPDRLSTIELRVPAADLVAGDNHLVFTFARAVRDPGGSIERAAYFRSIELRAGPPGG